MYRCFAIAIFLIAATAMGQAQTFSKTKMIDAKGKEVPVTLEFGKAGLAVKTLKTPIADVPYRNRPRRLIGAKQSKERGHEETAR
jgi:hypothetical protein